MDLLRKLFGLQPAPAERRPPSTMMDGPTAPLDVKITAGRKKDEADPSLIWVIISTGGMIVLTLSYVGWRKYRGEKEKNRTHENE